MKFIEDSYQKVENLIDKSFLSPKAKQFYKESYKEWKDWKLNRTIILLLCKFKKAISQ